MRILHCFWVLFDYLNYIHLQSFDCLILLNDICFVKFIFYTYFHIEKGFVKHAYLYKHLLLIACYLSSFSI